MDKNNKELRHYMKTVREEFDDRLGRHPSEEELIAYQRGRLADSEQGKVQSHLVQCDVCLAAFKSISDFFASPREELMREVDVGQEWQSFRRRVRTESMETGALSQEPSPPWFGQRAALALAASLLLALGIIGIWALRLQQEKQQLGQQWQTRQNSLEERLSQLEQDNRRRQEQSRAMQQKYESQLAELRQPKLNVPVYDILPQGSARSTGPSIAAQIKVPTTASSFMLVLNGEGQSKYPDYRIEILDKKGRVVWQSTGLQRNREGNFALILDRTFLPEGRYHLQLYGQRRARSIKMADYAIDLK